MSNRRGADQWMRAEVIASLLELLTGTDTSTGPLRTLSPEQIGWARDLLLTVGHALQDGESSDWQAIRAAWVVLTQHAEDSSASVADSQQTAGVAADSTPPPPPPGRAARPLQLGVSLTLAGGAPKAGGEPDEEEPGEEQADSAQGVPTQAWGTGLLTPSPGSEPADHDEERAPSTPPATPTQRSAAGRRPDGDYLPAWARRATPALDSPPDSEPPSGPDEPTEPDEPPASGQPALRTSGQTLPPLAGATGAALPFNRPAPQPELPPAGALPLILGAAAEPESFEPVPRTRDPAEQPLILEAAAEPESFEPVPRTRDPAEQRAAGRPRLPRRQQPTPTLLSRGAKAQQPDRGADEESPVRIVEPPITPRRERLTPTQIAPIVPKPPRRRGALTPTQVARQLPAEADEPTAMMTKQAVIEGLTVDQYASLAALCALFPEQVEANHERYGVAGPAERAALATLWQRRFEDEPALLDKWQQLFEQYRSWYERRAR